MQTSTSVWSQAAELFARTVDLPADERERVLAEHSANSADPPGLLAAVRRLLAAHQSLDAAAESTQADRWNDAAGAAVADWIEHDGERLAPGQRAGAFTIERELGAGGMGRVYLAYREIDDGRQQVALKVAAFHRLAPQVRQRLRRERQLLASLEHPNIARLVDAGELASDRPYFAMEYVDGEPILAYCDRLRLSLRARIALMLPVLSAVEYAHQRLVLHRDLKAGNVLVDRDGRPKLLDFGIAKTLVASQPDADAATADAHAFFSPASAAPEQVLGAPTGVATDVYALGALMYELFVGELPLATTDASPAMLAHAIATTVPALPSRALARLAKQTPERAQAVAQQRSAGSAQALARQLQGDVDAILARCLRKEPQQRYPSVERLAADLRAVLESRPIAARRDESLYRLGKFARRHAAALSLAALAAALSIGFVGHIVLQSRELELARDRAQARRMQAERVTAFMVDLFRASDPEQARGRDPSARELLARGSQRLQRVDDAQIRAALASAIADIDLALDDLAGAERHSADALRLLQGLPEPDPSALRTAYALRARVALARAEYAPAQNYLDRAFVGLPADAVDERLLLQRQRAELYQAQGRLDESLRLWESLDPQFQRRYGLADPRTAQARRAWASALRASDQHSRAALLLAQLPKPAADGQGDNPATAKSIYTQALQQRDAGQYAQAEQLALEALRIDLKLYGERHSETSKAFNALGTIAQARNDYPAAVAYFERSLTIKRAVNGEKHPSVAGGEYNLGLMQHLYLGKPALAEPHLRKAVEIGAQVLPAEHPNLALYRLGWAMALRDLDRVADARAALAAARERLEGVSGQELNLALAQSETLCMSAGPIDRAGQRELDRDLETVRAELAADHPKRQRVERCNTRLDALAKR
ncbi:protein kinase domain-containing protein [Pseudomonas sp. CGJS7]|uniref:protein kinase domain-containing protein n=1 Tax=Pseudomonas sp. CGJS7 TaxID=3109348 RepID=UPI003009400C